MQVVVILAGANDLSYSDRKNFFFFFYWDVILKNKTRPHTNISLDQASLFLINHACMSAFLDDWVGHLSSCIL